MKKAISKLLVISVFILLLSSWAVYRDSRVGVTPATKSSGAYTISQNKCMYSREPVTILLAAASSLEDVFSTGLIPMFQEKYP